MNFAMATLGLKEMGKLFWEGMEKSLPSWLSQFSKTIWRFQFLKKKLNENQPRM